MVSKHLAKLLREAGHHEVTAKNTSLRNLQRNPPAMDKTQDEEWKEALKNGTMDKYRKKHPYGV